MISSSSVPTFALPLDAAGDLVLSRVEGQQVEQFVSGEAGQLRWMALTFDALWPALMALMTVRASMGLMSTSHPSML